MSIETEVYDQSKSVNAANGYELETPRTEAEQNALKKKVVTIARVFSKNGNIKVLPTATDNESWSCALSREGNKYYQEFIDGKRQDFSDAPPGILSPSTIFYTRGSLRRDSLEEVLGVLRHEIGHVNHTDFRLMLEGQRFVSQEGYLPMSWNLIFNALEDTWVNNMEMSGSEVVREQMEARYKARVRYLEETTPKQPANMQLAKNLLYAWITGKSMSTITDPKVLEVYEKMKPLADKFARGTSATENFRLLKEEIWPIFKEMEEVALRDKQIQEMIDKLMNQNKQEQGGQQSQQQSQSQQSGEGSSQGQPGQQSQAQGSSGQESGQGQKSQEPAPQGGLFQRLKGLLNKNSQNLETGSEQGQKQQLSPSPSGQPEAQPQKSQASEELANQIKNNVDQDLQERLKQEQKSPTQELKMEYLPEELQQQIEEAFEQLPQEIKNQLMEEAKEQLESEMAEELKKEQSAISKIEKNKETGRMEMKLNVNTPQEAEKIEKEVGEMEKEVEAQERADDEQRQREAQEQQRRLDEELKRQKKIREMKKEGFAEHEETAFDKFQHYEETVKRFVRNFIDRILPSLPRREEVIYEGLYVRGKKLDVDALARKVPIGDPRIMKKKEIISSEEARIFVQLIIDNSGSMKGTKMQESVKTAIFFARVLKTLNVPFAIKLFADDTSDLMRFDEDYDDPRNRVKPKLIYNTDAKGGGTNIGQPLQETYQEMIQAKRTFMDSEGMIFLITDGQANSGLTGTPLKDEVEKINKLFPIFVFGLGERGNQNFTSYLENIFGEGKVVMPESFAELPSQAGRTLLIQMSRLLRRIQN